MNGEKLDQRKGRPAEKHFSLLCSQANITCNRSEEDDHGWDFIVEIPMPRPERLSADLVGQIRKCEIQVKALEKPNPVVKLSLENARAFAKSHLPCFIVAILGQNTPSPRVYIRHFWKDEIEQSLKRVREAGNKGKPLNKSFTQFTLSKEEDQSLDAIGWLVNTVQSLPRDYSSEKMRIEESVGYDDTRLKGEVRFGPLKGIEELVDHQLGLTESIPVEFVSIFETRFNLPSTIPIFAGKPSSVSLRSKATKECSLILRSEEGASMVVAARVTAPAIPNLPLEALKLKIETWFFSIVVSNGKAVDFNLSFNFETPRTLLQLSQLFQILSWAKQGAIAYSLVGDGVPLADGRMKLDQGSNEFPFDALSKIVSKLLNITERAGASIPSVAPVALIRNWSKCAQFYNLLMATGAKIRLTLDRVIASDVAPQDLVGYVVLDLGAVAFLAVLEFRVESELRNGKDMVLALAAPLIRDCYLGSDIEAMRAIGEERISQFGRLTEKTLIEVGNLLDLSIEGSER